MATGVVDVNIIPAALVESVEIITGGASAVYGSDAIAGVVNFKLKDEFEGLQFDGGWAVTDQGDGEEYSAGITGGFDFADGRGRGARLRRVLESRGDHVRRARFSELRARPTSGPARAASGPTADSCRPDPRSCSKEGRAALRRQPAGVRRAVRVVRVRSGHRAAIRRFFGVNQDGSLFTTGNGSPGSVVNFRGERDPLLFNDRVYTYNFAPWNYLQLPLERVSAFARRQLRTRGAVTSCTRSALYADYSADRGPGAHHRASRSSSCRRPIRTFPRTSKFLLDSRTNPAADLRISQALFRARAAHRRPTSTTFTS